MKSAQPSCVSGRRTIRYFLPVGVFGLVVVFLGIGLGLDPKKVPSPLIDKQVPAFDLPRLYQPSARFSEQTLADHVSLVNVFASWCVACRQEHPFLVEISRSGVVPVYGLNYKDQRTDAMKWLQDLGNPYSTIAFDLKGEAGLDWGVYGVPETFVIDKKGVIRYKQIGPLDWATWQQTLLPLVTRLKAESRS
ncbi:MAG: thiol:disulfide interchange protein [marine bacterium B5-7]|nr:MAG: thiol:disulfide interchange protein [marine bacterium B5-7]